MRLRNSMKRAVLRGFSLIEMLVAVGLLSLVILALYAMFDQTQRALRGSVGQVDVFEGSRSALELLTRDLEQARPAGVFDGPHFLSRLSVPATLIQNQEALFQERQPVLQEFFGVRNITDQQWSAFGYFIAAEETPVSRTSPPIGTLYRYEDRGQVQRIPGETTVTNTPVRFLVRGRSAAPNLFEHLLERPFAGSTATLMPYRTNAARVLDGVLNFRVTPYDALGRPYNVGYPTNDLPLRPSTVPASVPPVAPLAPVLLNHVLDGLLTETTFSGTAMPASVEIEVDALEPRLLEQYRALPDNPGIRNKFLTNNLARIQSFRQRVPLRPYLR
jgi:prepilin-type N-terminal cleavage/methylation domain-containing protein